MTLARLTMSLLLGTTLSTCPAPAAPLPPAVALLRTETSSPLLEPRISAFDPLFFAELSARPELILVEREELGAALQEFGLRANATTSSAGAVQIGRWTGARIIISARAVAHGRGLGVAARILGVETGGVIVVDVAMNTPDRFDAGARELAAKVAAVLAEKGDALVPPSLEETVWLETLRTALQHRPLPPLVLSPPATRNASDPVPAADRIVAEEIVRLWENLGGQIFLDPPVSPPPAALLVRVETRATPGPRHGEFVSARAHVFLTVSDIITGQERLRDRQVEIALEASATLAQEAALRRSARALVSRLLRALPAPASTVPAATAAP